MGFNTGDAFSRAAGKLLAPIGIIITGGYLIASLLSSTGQQNLVEASADEIVADVREAVGDDIADLVEEAIAELPLAFGLSESVANLLVILGFIGTIIAFAVGIASFAKDSTGADAITLDRLVWNSLNLFAGAIVFGIAVIIGLALLVIPGLIILLVLVFFPAAIAIDGENFIEAFGSSVDIVRDNAIQTIGIIAGWILLMIVVGIVGSIFSFVLPPLAGEIISQVISALGVAYLMALLATAYVLNQDEQPESEPTDQFDPQAEPWE